MEQGNDMLGTSRKLLSINPEHYTAWNHRKRAIERMLPSPEFTKEELEFNVSAIKINPKSYVTWEHRRWLLKRVTDEGFKGQFVQHELLLLEKLLKLDSRNCK